uniref:Uncharacterized protein n=1 Tax=Meloidogyne hapla TaxID=6305 RepID=A0A1I8BFW2_MELHA
MAAAGLLDEKEENGILKCGCVAFICKLIHQICKHKRLIMSNKKSEEAKTTNKKQSSSFWQNISPRNWGNNSLKSQMIDIEEGIFCDVNSNENCRKENNASCTNRKLSSAKKFLAIEREATPNSIHGWGNSAQLQVLSTGSLTRHEKFTQSSFSNVPLIVCKESEDEESEVRNNELEGIRRRDGQVKQRNAVDQREAARLANWAQPNLSCEALSIQDGKMTLATKDSLLALEVNQSELSTPLKRTVSTLFSSNTSPNTTSRKQSTVPLNRLIPESPSPSTKSAMGLELPISRSLSRRASAMASLLDPINIGSGERRESFASTTPNVGSQTSGDVQQTLTPRSKWRHAIRKLQMNKREAGRMQAKKIDAWSRWAFPLSYFSFHAAYWYYYLRLAA